MTINGLLWEEYDLGLALLSKSGLNIIDVDVRLDTYVLDSRAT